MRTSGPDREASVLARIEAEFRASDPRFLALFDRLGEAGRGHQARRRQAASRLAACRRPPARRAWLFAMLLSSLALVLAAALTAGRAAGWHACPAALGCPGITAVADQAVAMAQAQTADWGREVRAQLCRSIPAEMTSRCG